nr:hypothetical protein [Pandoravirus massiliensis]
MTISSFFHVFRFLSVPWVPTKKMRFLVRPRKRGMFSLGAWLFAVFGRRSWFVVQAWSKDLFSLPLFLAWRWACGLFCLHGSAFFSLPFRDLVVPGAYPRARCQALFFSGRTTG